MRPSRGCERCLPSEPPVVQPIPGFVSAFARPVVELAELVASTGDVIATLGQLRRLTVMDFGILLINLPCPELPAISALLPRMVPPETQTAWAGSHGFDLYRGTQDTTWRLRYLFEKTSRRPIESARIIDFGCGFGRLGRMMLYFVEPADLLSLDPWRDSIDLCRAHGMLGEIAQSSFVPLSLPTGGAKYDLVFAYSVFTHTSPRAALASLQAIRNAVRDDGVLIITLRPIEFLDEGFWAERPGFDRDRLRADFTDPGFAFFPLGMHIVEGEDVFGEAIINPDWLRRNCPRWRVAGFDRGVDLQQLFVVLTPG
jgi:SAM-dependent methyltransferase